MKFCKTIILTINDHGGHWGIKPPQKHHLLFLAKPSLNQQTVQAPPPTYWFFKTAHLKVGSFNEPPKYKIFSSLIPSYLLKVTKFLGKISQFKFLVMTEKNIFAYKLLSLNISDFNVFLCENCNPPEKKSPPSFPATLL